METLQDLTIRNETVAMDNVSFVHCTLIDCVLEYSGYPVSFEGTEMQGCRFVFSGHAQDTVQFLQSVGLMFFETSRWGDSAATGTAPALDQPEVHQKVSAGSAPSQGSPLQAPLRS